MKPEDERRKSTIIQANSSYRSDGESNESEMKSELRVLVLLAALATFAPSPGLNGTQTREYRASEDFQNQDETKSALKSNRTSKARPENWNKFLIPQPSANAKLEWQKGLKGKRESSVKIKIVILYVGLEIFEIFNVYSAGFRWQSGE